ncbi:type II secretion system protein [Patescibacteria group bacterium]
MRKINKQSLGIYQKGFTLVELLVVMAILGILVTLVAGTFRNSQIRGRDVQRKSDIKQISNALELFYSDYGKYPDSSSGLIAACPYNPTTESGAACTWGSGEFTDSKTIYFKTVPADPADDFVYNYRVVDSPFNQKYQLFARIENPEDINCLGGDCAASPVTYSCGSFVCNFAQTSPNTTPTD